jgi:hypothetical protein
LQYFEKLFFDELKTPSNTYKKASKYDMDKIDAKVDQS